MTTDYGSSRYGFTWGPMKVERLAVVDRGKQGTSHVLGVTTDRDEIQVYVSRTGMVRVFRKGKGEMKVTP